MGPYHNGVARPRFMDGGHGLQIWRVAANILNKQSRTADKEWYSSLWGGRGAKNHHKNQLVTKCYTGPYRILLGEYIKVDEM
jgi:hypothetical protein